MADSDYTGEFRNVEDIEKALSSPGPPCFPLFDEAGSGNWHEEQLSPNLGDKSPLTWAELHFPLRGEKLGLQIKSSGLPAQSSSTVPEEFFKENCNKSLTVTVMLYKTQPQELSGLT